MNRQHGLAVFLGLLSFSLVISIATFFIVFKSNAVPQPISGYSIEQTQASDAKIKSDFHALQQALEEYKEKNGNYPADLNDLVDQGFLTTLPKDPYTHSNYYYLGSSGDYYLTTQLGTGKEYRVSNH
jgi:general secretion pathway protein G